MTIDMLPWVLSVVCSLYCTWRMIVWMSWDGKVDNAGRMAIAICWIPLISVGAFVVLLLIEGISFFVDTVWSSKKVITWRINRKIRVRRRGPLVRLVEWLHNRRKEKSNADVLPH